MELLTYIFKVNLIFSIIFLGYYLATRQTVYHQWNRFYLLVAPLIALCIPFLTSGSGSEPVYVVEMPQLPVQAAEGIVASSTVSLIDGMVWVWCLGCAIAFFTALFNVRASVKNKEQSTGHTFMGRIHIDPSLDPATAKKVLLHEEVHAKQWHSLDLLWYEVLRVAFWFNPLFLVGRRSLKTIHEYIADEEANRNTTNYPETLVASAFGLSALPLANEFNSVNIKNRVKMITKKKSAGQRASLLGSALIVALAAVSIGWTAVVVPSDLGKEEVYEKVEKMPHFPGCNENGMSKEELKKCSFNLLVDYMGKTVKYPEQAKKDDTEGTVMVKFIVTSEGAIKKATVVKNVSEELDAEALRVIQGMPNWVPGEKEGKKVNVSMVLPISFKMS